MAYRRSCYFRECPFCGAALDPGEICDCREPAAERETDPEREAENTAGSAWMRPAYDTERRQRRATA